MRYHRIFRSLTLSIILLLVAAFPAIPTYAAVEVIKLHPDEGEIGDKIEIEGHDFNADEVGDLYFSSDEADEDDEIDTEVKAYEHLRIVETDASGDFTSLYKFEVPDELTDGEDDEYVHGGQYYVYATYHDSTIIVARDEFTVIGGEIEIDPEEGQIGTEVEISGNRFGISQEIRVEYDDKVADIVSGDEETDDEGGFTCTIIIPESTFGDHTITVTDESGNEPEAEFSVKPKITIDPASGAVGELVEVKGIGFDDRAYITITFDNLRISTIPLSLDSRANGSFTGSFAVPSQAVRGTSRIRASDGSNSAEAELTIFAGISLDPATNQSSPGHIGMELTIYGTGFTTGSPITITYDQAVVTTITTDSKGKLSVTFTIPPSVAGDHTVTVTGDTDVLMSTVTIESEAPPIPVPLLPEVSAIVEAETHFDWEDVDDPSGVTYTLQIAANGSFTTIVLEQTGLTQSEYTLKKGEELKSPETGASYYWRVKAIDGASNEGKWTIPMLFYVGYSPQEEAPSWNLYLWIGLGTLLIGIFGFWIFKRTKG